MIRDPIELWLNQHVDEGKRIAELVLRQAVQAKPVQLKKNRTKKKTSGIAVFARETDGLCV